MKQYQEEPIYLKLFNGAIQAAMDDELPVLKELLEKEKSLFHFHLPLREILVLATANGSLAVFRYLVETYGAGNCARIDIKEDNNLLFRLAWRKGHLNIIEDLILNQNITHDNLALQETLDKENYLEKTQIINWIKTKNEQLELKKMTPTKNNTLSEESSEYKVSKI